MILNKFWINKHEIIFNIINDECYFISNHYDHVKIFFLLSRSFIFQKLFNSNKQSNRTFYLSSSKRFLTSSSFVNIQKYQIFQRRSISTFSRIIFFRFTIKDSEKNTTSIKKFLNSNFKYVIEKIDKNYSSNKSFKKKRKTCDEHASNSTFEINIWFNIWFNIWSVIRINTFILSHRVLESKFVLTHSNDLIFYICFYRFSCICFSFRNSRVIMY